MHNSQSKTRQETKKQAINQVSTFHENQNRYIIQVMKTKPYSRNTLWLASQSPRRREMLGWLDVTFEITRADVNETPRHGESPADLTSRLARTKTLAVQPAVSGAQVLAADTIVALDGAPLGKPRDEAEARSMLHRLRHDAHAVYTTVTLHDTATGRLITRRVTTEVWMRSYSDAEMERYIASGDPFDKAGGYAIQHAGFNPVARLDRCYANVMGLPLCAVVALLRQMGCNFTLDLRALCQEKLGYACLATDAGEHL